MWLSVIVRHTAFILIDPHEGYWGVSPIAPLLIQLDNISFIYFSIKILEPIPVIVIIRPSTLAYFFTNWLYPHWINTKFLTPLLCPARQNRHATQAKLNAFFLDKQFPIKQRGDNTCMIDFIWHQCQNKNGFKRYTYQKSKDELSEFATSFPFMSTQEVVDWARGCHPNVSIHAYDSTYKKFMKHITSTPRHDISHVFFIKENHCYPITDERLKILATYHGFTCRSMDTAQAIWTSGLASGKKISIDNYKNSLTDQELFLVRERQTERIFSENTSINWFV